MGQKIECSEIVSVNWEELKTKVDGSTNLSKFGQTVEYFPSLKKLVTIGGDGCFYSVLDFRTETWKRKDCIVHLRHHSSVSVSSRYDSSEKYKILVIGGRTISGNVIERDYSETNNKHIYEIAVTENDEVWERVDVRGEVPQVHYHESVLSPERNEIYTFGGRMRNSENIVNLLWRLKIKEREVEEVVCDQPSSSLPTSRLNHSLCVVKGNKILLYGGYTGSKHCNDLWEFCTETNRWREIRLENHELMEGRCAHHMISLKNRSNGANTSHVIIGSGYYDFYLDVSEKNRKSLSAFWYIDYDKKKAKMIQLEDSEKVMWDYSMIHEYEKNQVFVFGGNYKKVEEGVSGTWTNIELHGNRIQQSQSHHLIRIDVPFELVDEQEKMDERERIEHLVQFNCHFKMFLSGNSIDCMKILLL